VGRRPARRVSHGHPIFAVQKHAATRLHYDFRLEMGGVLKSWAVPKGVPTTKGDKRLAMQVEDHPLEYGSFEGAIPPGNYGAGTVMLWDTGTYEVLDDGPETALRKGKLVVRLIGHKLKGQWTLVRMRHSAEGSDKTWLLIKTGEEIRPIGARADDQSVQSGRTMKEIAADKTGKSRQRKLRSRSRNASPRRSARQRTGPALQATRLPNAAPRFVEPMKALLSATLPKGDDWLFEVKLDGIRAIAIKNGREVRIFSRRPRDLTDDYPDLVEALGSLPAEKLVLDGEIVALDERGCSSFQLLQNLKRHPTKRPPIFFYLFDLINLDGRDLQSLPLTKRKAALETLLHNTPPPLRFSGAIKAEAAKVWEQVKRLGLEGVIAKRRDSKYEAGRRSGAWLKIKAQNVQEFVIGGYSPPKGARKYFGSILVGYYEGPKLMFASKVGTGFDFASLRSLYQLFQKYKTSVCPFANLPTKRTGRSGQGITLAEMNRCTWLKPKLVCQVKFLEWTRDGNLRQPAFLGLRDDKTAEEVVREKIARQR
jgi:bifunctional non-homologous end joining protein LigD